MTATQPATQPHPDPTRVSLRELQAALAAARAGRGLAGVTCSQTGGDSRTGGRLSPPPTSGAAPGAVPVGGPAALLATHGGSGARCLAAALGALGVLTDWPDAGGPPVLLVARTHAHGLQALQHCVREHRDSDSGARLAGAALVSDAPGRLPLPLRRMRRLVSAALPRVWDVPWVPAWRLGEPDPATRPDWAVQLLTDLTAVTR